jgi:hypothetical protein
MGVSVFLSYSTPISSGQRRFVGTLTAELTRRGLAPRTLGVTDYDVDSPLVAIRRVLLESNGLIAVALRRWKVEGADVAGEGVWTTSPYCHIEAAMAFQMGLPVVVLVEDGVLRDGALRDGVIGPRTPPLDLRSAPGRFLRSTQWGQIADKWEHQVRTVLERKGHPRRWFD